MPRFNFGGLEEEYSNWKKASAAVLPVPFDSTSTYLPGSRFGPQAIINASRFIRLYDDETKSEPFKKGVFTLDELEPARGDAGKTVNRVEYEILRILEAGKFPMVLGGEHSISLGFFRALKKKFGDVSVLQLDAHPDLWDEIEGSKYSHSCVGKRIFDELGGKGKLAQVGLRSFDKVEEEFIEKNFKVGGKLRTFYQSEISKKGVEKISGELTKLLGGKNNVFVTVDFDVLNSSEMPSVGTPEPGGMKYSELLALLKRVFSECNVVGIDFCELTPIPGFEAPNYLAAKVCYKSLAYKFGSK
jgi:agmatinase